MKQVRLVWFTALCVLFHAVSYANTYYLSSAGNDSNSGLSVANAWKTISKLNTIDFEPGDSVLFEGGSVFTGNLLLEAEDAGTPSSPIFISSYGAGRAIISAGNSYGIKAYNCAGFRISNLDVEGSGATVNNAIGIDIYMDVASDLSYLRIDSCNVNGFKDYGIQLGCWDTNAGFRDVRVTHVNSFGNGSGGMYSFGFNTLMNHEDVYVGYSSFHDNKGRTDVTNTNTGNGIVLSGIENAMIEYCEAYNNGENNSNALGGPVGIWFYLVKNGVIQYCESHHNHTGTLDGGGFDLDGGSQNCIIQYCYSHDNAGPGYLMAEYGSNVPFTGNIIRYNISQNDARKSSAGAIMFSGADDNNRILQSQVHNNTIFLNAANVQDGTPAAVKLIGNKFSDVKLSNNIFYTSGAVHFVNADMDVDSSMLHFLYNDYYSGTSEPSFVWAWTTYNSLSAWKTAAITQERRGSTQSGLEVDPLLLSAGNGGTVGLAQLNQMPVHLSGYKLRAGSPVHDAGINMTLLTSSGIGTQDFFGNPPFTGISQDIGAHECNNCNAALPLPVVSLSVRRLRDEVVALSWTASDPSDVKIYTPEYSLNGKDFYAMSSVNADGFTTSYLFNDSSYNGAERFYRLRVVQKNGQESYSNVVAIGGKNKEAGLSMSVISRTDSWRLLVKSPFRQRVMFSIINANGQLIHKEARTVEEGASYHEFTLPTAGGLYFLNAIDAAGRPVTVVVHQ
jgi:hypothetical protein